MAAARFAFATRQRDVEMRADFVNGEGFTDNVDLSESIKYFSQTRRIDSINFNVPILWPAAHQLVAYAPAHEQGATSGIANCCGQFQNFFRDIPHRRKGGQ